MKEKMNLGHMTGVSACKDAGKADNGPLPRGQVKNVQDGRRMDVPNQTMPGKVGTREQAVPMPKKS